MSIHHSHEDVIKRLRRANGHLAKVIAMIETGRPCPEAAQQLHAVVNALVNAKNLYVRDHIQHCVRQGLLDKSAAPDTLVDELTEISKYL